MSFADAKEKEELKSWQRAAELARGRQDQSLAARG
jgi:hypothetical protein